MGEKYTTESISGYNSAPPADDGTETEANKVKWATHKDKLSDPIKTQVANIDTKLLAMADVGPNSKAVNYTTLTTDHQKTIEVSVAGVTITLLAVTSAPEGYTIKVKNTSGGAIFVDGTASEEIDGSTTALTVVANESTSVQLNQAKTAYISLQQRNTAVDSVMETSGYSENLAKLIHPDESKGLQELQAQGVYPSSFNQQWGGMGYGGLPDGTLGEVATCNISSDSTSTTINATNVDCAFKVPVTTTISTVFIKIYKSASLTGNTTVTINSEAETVPEKTITSKTDGEWIRVDFSTPPSVTADTSYNINVATTGNAIEWMDGNGNYPHGGNNQFIIVTTNKILSTGLTGFDGALHHYEGAPLNQSGGFYFKNSDLNHKRGTIHLAGTGWDKDKTFYDSGLSTDANRIVLRCNVTTGYAQVDLYESDETKHTITGTTDISTGNRMIDVIYRSEGDGADVLYLYVDGASEGTPLTAQTFTLDRAFEDGHTTIGGGFPLAPTWTDSQDMSALPSSGVYSWGGAATEANAFVVSEGVGHQNGAAYGATQAGYNENASAVFVNATGGAIAYGNEVESTTNGAASAEFSVKYEDDVNVMNIYHHEYFIELNDGSNVGYVFWDGKQKSDFMFTAKGSDFRYYANGVLIFDGEGLFDSGGGTSKVGFGDYSTTSGDSATGKWYYFDYYQGAHLPEYSTMQLSESANWSDDKSALLPTVYNSGVIQSVKALAGMNENSVKRVKQVISVEGIITNPSTTSTSLVPLDDLATFHFGASIRATYAGTAANDTGGSRTYVSIKSDGSAREGNFGESSIAGDRVVLYHQLSKQTYSSLHHTEAVWRASANTSTMIDERRDLIVEAEQ